MEDHVSRGIYGKRRQLLIGREKFLVPRLASLISAASWLPMRIHLCDSVSNTISTHFEKLAHLLQLVFGLPSIHYLIPFKEPPRNECQMI